MIRKRGRRIKIRRSKRRRNIRKKGEKKDKEQLEIKILKQRGSKVRSRGGK